MSGPGYGLRCRSQDADQFRDRSHHAAAEGIRCGIDRLREQVPGAAQGGAQLHACPHGERAGTHPGRALGPHADLQDLGKPHGRQRRARCRAPDPRLFQPRSRTNDGGASARFAAQLAHLSPPQRGALHLVYGERLSYDEVAEIFDVPVSMIIARLAKAYSLLDRPEQSARQPHSAAAHNRQSEKQEQRQERAA
ncbi:MAG: hypothetical protein HC850_03350 [Rhodomicrobium sp.]|nr:hypothetical protein [Rhodomicrobium sp.]